MEEGIGLDPNTLASTMSLANSPNTPVGLPSIDC